MQPYQKAKYVHLSLDPSLKKSIFSLVEGAVKLNEGDNFFSACVALD